MILFKSYDIIFLLFIYGGVIMKYEKPEVNMFKFDVEDVITTSMPFTTTTTAPSQDPTIPVIPPRYDVDYEEL